VTAGAAFDALSPNTTLGDLTYRGASGNVRLAGHTAASQKFLAQTGTGAVSAAPSWQALVAGDIPSLDASKVTTGTFADARIASAATWNAKADATALPAFGYVTGSDFTTTSTSLVDITGLSVALAVNSKYEVFVWLSCATSADINGIQFALNYSVAGGGVEAWVTPGVFTSNSAFRTDRFTALNTATGNRYLQTSAQDGFIVITGTVTTGANAGNLVVRCLKATSGTATVRIGSYIKVIKTA
jgi:hypothetical protein